METFQSAVQNVLLVDDLSTVLNTFYSNFNPILNTTATVEEFLRPWLEERNYPIVTIDFIPKNETYQNTTFIFRQNLYSGSFENTQNPTWKIYIECDVGGIVDNGNWNLTSQLCSIKNSISF